jgi:methionyl aminopeptidase
MITTLTKTLESNRNVADKYGYAIPEALTGHGIGREFHTVPFIFHIDNQLPWIMEPGMIFTIEPIFLESAEGLTMWDDQWTLATRDDTRAAQFENTVLITETGVQPLTQKQ